MKENSTTVWLTEYQPFAIILVTMTRNSSFNNHKLEVGMRSRKQIAIDTALGTKVCTRCKERLPFERYGVCNNVGDGRHSVCNVCKNILKREWEAKNPVAHTYNSRNSFYKRKFGITVDDYEKMLESQGGVCAICGTPPSKNIRFGKIERLAVDHCHVTGKVRGLLCHKCNVGLGLFSDNPDMLDLAARYLRK